MYGYGTISYPNRNYTQHYAERTMPPGAYNEYTTCPGAGLLTFSKEMILLLFFLRLLLIPLKVALYWPHWPITSWWPSWPGRRVR